MSIIPMSSPVNQSSTIDEVGAADGNLLVRFNSGKLYRYIGAAEHCAAMLTAESAGKYFNANIKPNYTFELIEG